MAFGKALDQFYSDATGLCAKGDVFETSADHLSQLIDKGLAEETDAPAGDEAPQPVAPIERSLLCDAMDDPSSPLIHGGPPAQPGTAPAPWQAARARFADTASTFADRPRAIRPMSALLADTFDRTGVGGGDHIRRAYDRLRSFGL